jgi:hypothetical protein
MVAISLVCDARADKASDDVLFKIHGKYLEATSARLISYAARTTPELDDQVPLDETSQVLEKFF